MDKNFQCTTKAMYSSVNQNIIQMLFFWLRQEPKVSRGRLSVLLFQMHKNMKALKEFYFALEMGISRGTSRKAYKTYKSIRNQKRA